MAIYEFLNDISLFLNRNNYKNIIEFRNVLMTPYNRNIYYEKYFKKYKYLKIAYYKNLNQEYLELKLIFQMYNYESPKKWMYSGSLYLHSIIFEEIMKEIQQNENFKI